MPHDRKFFHSWNFDLYVISRKEPKVSNSDHITPSGDVLTPSNFSRAFFKNTNREIPIEENDRKSNTSSIDISDVAFFHFSAATPRNLVVEDAAHKSRFQSEDLLKRHYKYIHNQEN